MDILRILLALAFLISVLFSTAQKRDITVNQLNINEGLAQSTVTSLHVDYNNQVWIGTWGGVNNMESNHAIEVFDNSIFENIAVRNLCFDKNKNLLIGTENGAYIYKEKKIEKIVIKRLQQTDKMLLYFSIGDFQIFVTRENKMAIINQKNADTTLINQEIITDQQLISCNNESMFWVTKNPNRIWSFDGKTGKITKIETPITNPIISIQKTDNEIVISENNYIWEYNFLTKTWKKIDLLNIAKPLTNNIKLIKKDFQNRYWIGILGYGIIVYDPIKNATTNYTGIYTNSYGQNFNLELITNLEFDKSGNAFIGTDGNGLIKINDQIRKFQHIIPSQLPNSKVKDNFVTAIYETKDKILYFSTLNSNLSYIDDKNTLKNIPIPKLRNPKYSIVYFIREYENNHLIIGTNQGLFTLDSQNNLKPINSPYANLSFNTIEKINQNSYLIGSEYGIYILSNHLIRKIETGQIDQISLIKKIDSTTFIVAEKGLGIFELKIKDFKANISKNNINGLNPNSKPTFTSFIEHLGYYYLGTSFGIVKFDKKFNQIKLYNQQNGLSNYHIYSLISDLKTKTIWIGTSRGLSKFDSENEIFHQFTVHDGIQSNEFNSNASHISADGKIFFGGVNGLNFFYPNQIRLNQNTPKIILSDILLFDHESIIKSNSINYKLNYNQNHLSFTFQINENTIPEKNQLKIQIKGIDKEWIDLKNRRIARYPYLPPGDYEVWAKASNNDNIWTEPQLIIKISILPPFYKRLWFRILTAVLLIITLSLVFYFIYLRNLKKKIIVLKQLQEIEKVRINISREIHDDIGSGLTQIALISEQIKAEQEIHSESSFLEKKLDKLTLISRELIQSMGEIVWYINPNNDSFSNLLLYIRVTINRIIEDTNFDINYNFPENIPNFMIKSDARRKIVLIIKEAVNNSIKYSQGNCINIKLEIMPNSDLSLSISDNGKGIENQLNELGNGLKNMKQNAKELDYIFSIISNKMGTIITISGQLGKITTKM